MDLFVRVFLLYKHIRVYSLSAALCNSSQIHSEAFSSACGFFSHTGFHVNIVFFFIFVFLYCVIDLIKSLKPLNDVARLRIIIKLKKKANKINGMKFSSFQY